MKADVQISRIHKNSPFNVSEVLQDIEGKDHNEIFYSELVQTAINKAYGNKLRVTVITLDGEGDKEYYINKQSKNRVIQQLVKITEQNGNKSVSARELHKFLEVGTRFDKWILRMFEYGFTQNTDYQCLVKNDQMPNGGVKQVLDDYALTLDTAKEIAMIQRTPKGKQVRQYFIEVERLVTSKAPISSPYQKTNKNAISEKRSELVDVIRNYLRWGDMSKVAKKLNIEVTYVKKVMVHKKFNTEQADLVTQELYKIALKNKNELLFGYQQMIDMLKK